ncbi:MFS transporter [Thalassorhabdomicrobium marinisediminis]|uniref:MFS transporter n=1 Tax=Thalassorhabdomicrobium marinisediminis TaxID=2170577 RepID=UPI0018C8B987|nr:MFS transporter [Thalassorhabdomicrobium marinisediminis]
MALTSSKSADGLVDPKLVLSWLLSTLGAGAFWIGALVPVREAGALLPQLALAGRLKAMQYRKWAWVAGALGQAASVAAIVLAALTLQGDAAGGVIVGILAVLALSRSVCSVSYKDVLGKTVRKRQRGQTMGKASTAAAVTVIVFAGILMALDGQKYGLVIGALVLAALLYALAGFVMAQVEEGASDAGEADGIVASLRLLLDRPQLRLFIMVRALLVGSALAPPYLVMLAGGGGVFEQLGALVLASALGALASSYVWGWLSDRSARLVLVWSGLSGAAALAVALMVGSAGGVWGMPVVLFGLMVSYHGVRQGRSTYLVDMADETDRAAYTAVSNTAIGAYLLGVGALSAGLATVSVPLVIGVFAVMCCAGGALALKLEEVQHA